MRKTVLACLVLILASATSALGDVPGAKEADARREAAIAEFTRKMKDANYPVLFDQAAKEFNVPVDVLKGVAFAETRWEQLSWAPGETASPETGMPRPYGIMSLWDNKYFGHSLIEAAGLIGVDPQVLKQDPFQNMRGGAALLRKLYDQSPKPDGTTEADVEGWRYAIRKYCGIPEPDLAASHVLDVYVFMSKGYHQYGIEWDARPVNLEPIREETRRIVAEERAKRAAVSNALSNQNAAVNIPQLSTSTMSQADMASNRVTSPVTTPAPAVVEPVIPSRNHILWFILGALAALGVLWWFSKQQSKPSQ